MELACTPEQASGLMLLMPAEARVLGSGVIYDGTKLTVPPWFDADLKKLTKGDWKLDTLHRVLFDYAGGKRRDLETGGIKVDGVAIATDRRSQALIAATMMFAQIDASKSFQWKIDTGQFISLTAAQLIDIGNAVVAHNEKCFAAEAEVVNEIKNGQIIAISQIDAAFAKILMLPPTGTTHNIVK
jgi:hypothetical protein